MRKLLNCVGNERLMGGLVENFPADKDSFSGNVFVITDDS